MYPKYNCHFCRSNMLGGYCTRPDCYKKHSYCRATYLAYEPGKTEFSFVINNQTILAHTFYHANTITTPWAATPFIPMRVEIENISYEEKRKSLEEKKSMSGSLQLDIQEER